MCSKPSPDKQPNGGGGGEEGKSVCSLLTIQLDSTHCKGYSHRASGVMLRQFVSGAAGKLTVVVWQHCCKWRYVLPSLVDQKVSNGPHI